VVIVVELTPEELKLIEHGLDCACSEATRKETAKYSEAWRALGEKLDRAKTEAEAKR
jgi:hypothetical protein